MAEDTLKIICNECGHEGLDDGCDGFYYCAQCGARADDIMDTGVADEDFVNETGDTRGALYQPIHTRHRPSQTLTPSQPFSVQDTRHSQFWSQLESVTQPPPETTAVKNREWDRRNGLQDVKRRLGDFDALGPTDPEDFASGMDSQSGLAYEDYYNEVRNRYVMGMQMMIQYQCEALVEKFKVTPLICGLVGPIWLRFVALSGVFDDGWADKSVQDSELLIEKEGRETKRPIRHKTEFHNLYGHRAVMIWVKSLKKSLPLSYSLAISFLACHISREPVLPTEIVRWAHEGKLPYLSSFVEIGKQMGEQSRACPISTSIMFKPSQIISPQRLETRAAYVAEETGLSLPPVNFSEIAARYLKELSLPVDKILPHACRIQNWSMPPDLYLSKNENRLPTRVCVLSILLVSIRILYNINGFGVWERSLGSISSCEMKDDISEESGSPSHDEDDSETGCAAQSLDVMKPGFDTEELLKNLEAKYHVVAHGYEYETNLRSFLLFGKDVLYSGLEESSFGDEYMKIRDLWSLYENEKDCKHYEDLDTKFWTPSKKKRTRDDSLSLGQLSLEDNEFSGKACHPSPSSNSKSGSRSCSYKDQASSPKNQTSPEALRERAIRRLKTDMEENLFCYIPPRVKLKRLDYLHYVRKKEKGTMTYVAHADYYILLRACARVAEVDARNMHMGVLSFERRLAWLEKRIEHCLHLNPPSMTCEFCTRVDQVIEDVEDDTISLSNLNI